MGNLSLYSVGKEMRKAHTKQPSSASHELAKSWATCEMPLTLETFELPACAPHITFCRLHHSWVSCEPSRDTHHLHSSSPNFHIEPITLNPTKIQDNDWRITIKFDTELMPTTKIENYNFTFWKHGFS